MPSIYPVLASRVTDQLLSRRLLSQFQFDNQELVRLQDQISTGYRVTVPSDDAPAATRAITLQRILEQKQQSKTSTNTTKSYVSATDNSLASVSETLAGIRAQALAAADSTTTQAQRDVMAAEIRRAIDEFADIGNRKFRGRFLFSGSRDEPPFHILGDHVAYEGNEESLRSLIDDTFVLDANVNGDEVFGAISPEVRGSVDLDPVLQLDTKLDDLRNGLGVTRGTILLSDGFTTKAADISSAETLGDVIRIIEQNAPEGRQLVARLSSNGIVVDIDNAGGGTFSIREVSGGTTAKELGLENSNGVGVAALIGTDLDPLLGKTTPLRNLLGSRATAVIESANLHNDILIEAVENGGEFNGVQVQFTSSGSVGGDAASAIYDATAGTLTIDINPNITRARTVVDAINATGIFVAELDMKLDALNDGSGTVDPASTGTFNGGSGIVFDNDSGLQIVNGGETFTLTFEGAETVEDVLNVLNGSGAYVIATISADGHGIDVRSRLSGTDFRIGENGGTTASELGIRTMTRETLLVDLNYERGVDLTGGLENTAGSVGMSQPHIDFTIDRKDGTSLSIDLRTALTVGDAIDLINNAAGEQIARLTAFGNGIEIIDENTAAPNDLTITRGESFAAWDLGLLARNTNAGTATSATFASASLSFPAPNDSNSAITITATQAGFAFNNVGVEIIDSLSGLGNVAQASFDATNNQLTVAISAGETTAATVLTAIASEPSGTFNAALDLSTDTTNDGSGFVSTATTTTAGGAAERILSEDVNPLETKGVFNSLLRLNRALLDNHLPLIQRAVQMLDDDFGRVVSIRAELGARERSLNVLADRIESEDIQLRATLSQEIDADLASSISELAARQANMEATLRLMGRSLQISLLNFI